MQFHILNENYIPVAVMDNDLSDAINFNNSKFHRFLTGSADFFDFETSKLHVDHHQFQVGYWLAFKYDDRDRLQYINEISEAESDKMMTISSVSSNLDLNNETKEPFSATEAKPFKWYFDIIMFDTGYEIGINEISNLTRKLSWESSMTARAFIQSVATQFDNAELDYEVVLNSDFTIKKRLVHIKKKIGEVRDDIELRYGDNVKTVKRTTSISELCTAVRPVSKDDNDKVVNISSLNDWQELDEKGNVKFFHKKGSNLIFAPQANARFGNRGHNVTGGGYIVHDFNYDKVSQNELFNRSHIYLKEHSVPAINYEVEGRTGAKIGDTVKIVDDGYTPELILSARVLEQVVSFDDASVEQATFGNYKALQSQISADLIAKMQQLAEENAPYKAVTLTTNGLTFKNSSGSTTLTARLYKGSKEIVPESYVWTINGVAISGNSEQHEITADDVNGKAVVRWSAVINGVTVAFDEVTVTDVSDGEDGISPTVTVNPDTSLTIVDFKGTKTTPVLKGTDGIAGKDGVGIKTTVITYAISTSGTTAPSTGWTSSVPSLVKGQYLWTKTVWTYTDNSTETGCSVTYISKDGNNGTDGIAGKDGVGIKVTTITYASHTNGTTAPTTGFTTTVPSVSAGQFLWTKTVWSYTDNTSETGYSVARMGLKGDKGDPGNNGTNGLAGKDGVGIKTTVITYQASTNGTTAPTGTWSASVPTVAKGSFLWTRTIWTYTDNTTETGYAVAYMGTNGNNGSDGIAGKDGVGIKTTTITYAGSTSGTTAPTSGWTSTVPTVAAGSYLWTKTVWAYTDNTSETGYSVTRMGLKGDKGDPGIKGSDGTSGIIVSSVAPTRPQTGQLWQDSSTTPQIVKKWTGNVWVIWEFYAQNLIADNISTISLNLGDMTGGTVKLMADVDVNGTLKKHGIYQSKLGLLSSGPSLATPSTLSNSQMGVANLNKGELRFMVTDYTENLKAVQEAGMSDQNNAFIKFDSYDNGKDVMVIGSSGDIVFKGITSQDTPWVTLSSGVKYKFMFSRVYISVNVVGNGGSFMQFGTLPQNLRPISDLFLIIANQGAGTADDRHMMVRASDGAVVLWTPKSGIKYSGEVSFTL